MADITIRHTRAGGTMIEGSTKGDGVYDVLRALRHNWRYFPSIRAIGVGQSRDKAANEWRIEAAAEALRKAGHTVTVEIDETAARSFAEQEADRAARAGQRAGYHAEKAGKRAAEADARIAAEHAILDFIPAGQPILIGHHSERRHRRDLDRAESHRRASIEADKAAEYHERRAQAAASYTQHRESTGTTLRRIAKLEAEARQVDRRIHGTGKAMHGEDTPATGAWLARLEQRAAEIAEQLAYWREVIAAKEAAGVKVWTRGDFAKGDFVSNGRRWFEVLRVNAKSVTIPAMISDGPIVTRANSRLSWTDTLPYDEVRGRKSAAEMTAQPQPA